MPARAAVFTKEWLDDRVFVDPRGCWIWMLWADKDGRAKVSRYGLSVAVARIVWTLYYGGIPQGLFVLHKCDEPACCNPEHLFLGTKGDNNKDRAIKGRSGRIGASLRERNAKIWYEQAEEIRRLRLLGSKQSALALQFGLCQSAISRIVTGDNWKVKNL